MAALRGLNEAETSTQTVPANGTEIRTAASDMDIRLPAVFRHPNYRLFFFGQMVSLMGTWMQAVALGWLVYRLTNSPFLLGLVTFVSQAPLFFISPFAGPLADRFNRRDVFVITQTLCMLQAGVLTIMTFTGAVDIGWLLALSLFGGIVAAVETPTRQSFTIEMVGREDLRQAIAYNAMMFNLARTIGPAIGGLLVAAVGEAYCFLLNTVSYAAVLASLLVMRLESKERLKTGHPLEEFLQGLRYVTGHPRLRLALALSAVTGFFGMSFIALLPAYTRDVMGQGSDALGAVMAAFGIGAFLGAATASRLQERHVATAPIVAAIGMGLTLICFANVDTLPLAVALVLPAGFSWLVIAVTNNIQIQFMAEDAIRGRVMGFYAMGALGSQAMGALLLGFIADIFDVRTALMLGGAACLIGAAVVLRLSRRL